MRRSVLLLIVLLLVPGAALAHDYWLEAEGAVAVGTEVSIRMWVGDAFHKGEEKAYRAKKATTFVHVDASGTADLVPRAVDGASPVATIAPATEGGHLVAMTRSASRVSLPGWKFTSYLKHEKFQHVVDARSAAGTTWDEGRERYTRYLKTLVQVGGERNEVYSTVLDHRLEIVPLNDPCLVEPGEALVLRVQFEGQPMAGLRAVARSKDKEEIDVLTDERGVARLVLPSAGVWMARAVYIRECAGCSNAEWESFWSSYQFDNRR